MPRPAILVGHSFILKGKVARGRRPLSFLSGRHICIIISFPRESRGFDLSLPIWSGQDHHVVV